MRMWLLAVAVLLCGVALSQQKQAHPEDLQARIERLVKQLGDEDFQKREDAMEELIKIGDAAIEALKKAAESEDPEVAWRAKEALNRILGKKKRHSWQKENPVEPFERFPRGFDRVLPEPLPSFPDEDLDFGKWEEWARQMLKRMDRQFKDMEEWRRRFEKRLRDLLKRAPSTEPDRQADTRVKQHGERMVVIVDPNGKMHIRRYVWRNGRLVEKVEKELSTPLAVLGADLVPVPDFLRYHLKLRKGEGLLVESLEEDSVLKKAGLQRGDIILSVDGKPIHSQDDFANAIEGKDRVRLGVLAAGKRKEIEVNLR
ncbi:MAG: hypothetical protein DRP82_00215 [Planctomycetota bacterium]|nr:MAG: hypothetical protein DRP82_00215 [Planctomycetota bacterium]